MMKIVSTQLNDDGEGRRAKLSINEFQITIVIKGNFILLQSFLMSSHLPVPVRSATCAKIVTHHQKNQLRYLF
jgi:hypothetical protein